MVVFSCTKQSSPQYLQITLERDRYLASAFISTPLRRFLDAKPYGIQGKAIGPLKAFYNRRDGREPDRPHRTQSIFLA